MEILKVKSIKPYMLFIIVLVVGMFASETVAAQAFCSIRDPYLHLKNMFPNNKSHTESIIDFRGVTVDLEMMDIFPGFGMGEFGAHSIFRVYDDVQMIGTLQSVSVLDRWGLAEVIIALDKDGALVDYTFQRCRNKWARAIEHKSVKDTLRGKSYSELLRKYSELSADLEKDSAKSADGLLVLLIESTLKAGFLQKIITAPKESPEKITAPKESPEN